MKSCIALFACVLPCIALNNPLHAGVITELTAISGPTSPASPIPFPATTESVDNDEDPTSFNFFQFVTALQITGVDSPIDFIFSVNDSGTGGTTEYLLNPWIVNTTSVPWTSMRYSLAAQTTAGGLLAVPGLDFDWPDQTALVFGAENFPNVIHQPFELFWSGGTAAIGANEITTFAIDVPDIGSDYDIVLTLDVFLPGDYTGDGFVGIEDLNVILGNWNATVTAWDLLAGDGTGDGFVGIEDLNQVLGNWNNGTPPVVALVPEPASLLVWPVGLLLLGRGRGRSSGV